MSSSDSTVTYTFVSSKDVPLWGIRFFGMEQPDSPEATPQSLIQTAPVPQDEDEREPMFIQPHDPDYISGPMYPKYISLEAEHVLQAEEKQLPHVVSPTVKSSEYVTESDPKEDPKEYEDEETEDGPVDYPMNGGDDGDDDDDDSLGDDSDDEEEDEGEEHLALADSAIVIPTDKLVSSSEGPEPAAISFPPEAEVERLLAMPTPSPSPLTSLSPPSAGERLARYDIRESSTARPIRDRGIDYRFVSTLDAEARQQGIGEVGYGIRDTWMVETLWVMGDMGREMGDMQAELLALREQPKRARQPGGDTRVPDHQDAPRDVDSHIYGFMLFLLLGHCTGIRIMAPVTRQGPNVSPNNTNLNNMTLESVQAMIDQSLLRNSINGDGSHSSHEDIRRNVQTARPCFYADFMKCQPLNFKGNEGMVGLTRWLKRWNRCSKSVVVLLKISGLPNNIYRSVKVSKPKTLDETIELANDLMDQKLRTYAKRKTNNKRKAEDPFRNNHGYQQLPLKRQNVAKVYNMGTGEMKLYSVNLPKCTKCHFQHNDTCTQKCHKCNKVGHFARNCRSSGNANAANAQRNNEANPKGNGCFECCNTPKLGRSGILGPGHVTSWINNTRYILNDKKSFETTTNVSIVHCLLIP
nr:hypothetical protein [Tanacetum cinerariifolium]